MLPFFAWSVASRCFDSTALKFARSFLSLTALVLMRPPRPYCSSAALAYWAFARSSSSVTGAGLEVRRVAGGLEEGSEAMKKRSAVSSRERLVD